MQVIVAIVAFRNVADVAQCLEGLARSTYPDFRVVVCENGGDDAHQAMRAALPDRLAGGQAVDVLNAPDNLGYGGGINHIAAHAPGFDAIWVLNPDTIPAPGALAAGVEAAGTADNAVIVGGPVVLKRTGDIQLIGGRWNAWMARTETVGLNAPLAEAAALCADPTTIDWIAGTSFLVTRAAWRQAGEMPHHYFLYCEEIAWCIAAVRRGVKLALAAGLVVEHAHGTTTGAGFAGNRSRLAVYLDERNRILLSRDLFAARLPITLPLSAAGLLARYLRPAARPSLRPALAGWWAGVRGEIGQPGWMRAK